MIVCGLEVVKILLVSSFYIFQVFMNGCSDYLLCKGMEGQIISLE